MSSFGDVRSACHARDLRALIEASYRKRRYILHDMHERYISDNMGEDEYNAYHWACAMINHLLEHTSVPHDLVRSFAASWAGWVLSGAVGDFPIRLNSIKPVQYCSVSTKWLPSGLECFYEFTDQGFVLRDPPLPYYRWHNLRGLEIYGNAKVCKGWGVLWLVDYKSSLEVCDD